MSIITDIGFLRTRLDERLAQLQAIYRGIYGQDIDLNPSSPDGQFLGALADAFSSVDSLAEAVYTARSAAGARGAGLSRLVQLNGISRKHDQYSTAPLTVGGVPGTVVPIGSLVSDPADPTVVFSTDADITIGSGGGGNGTGTATKPGPVLAVAGTLTNILTVVPGWSTVTNGTDAEPGSLGETDAALRVRRRLSVALPSQSMVDSIFASLAQLPNVTSAKVRENNTDVTDGVTGLPPHSMNALVAGGAPADILNVLYLKRSIGVTQVGAQSGQVVDAQGFPQTMRYDRPTETGIYVTVRTSAAIPADAANLIIDALAEQGVANRGIGRVVPWAEQFGPVLQVLAGLGAGAPRVSAIYVGTAPGPAVQGDVVLTGTAIDAWDDTHNGAGRIVVTT